MSLRYKPPPKGRGPSRHFSWAEVIGAGKSGYWMVPLGPFKLPSGKVVTPRASARKHADNMERLREAVNARRARHGLKPTGISVLSWARSWTHNLQVGGASDSRHLYFDASDITLQEIERIMPWPTGRAEFDAICDAVFKSGGFGTYPGGNRHVDSRGYRARWSSWVPALARNR